MSALRRRREVHRRRDHGGVRSPRRSARTIRSGRSAPPPTSIERSASSAVGLADLGRDELQVRTGINTGEVVASEAEPTGRW